MLEKPRGMHFFGMHLGGRGGRVVVKIGLFIIFKLILAIFTIFFINSVVFHSISVLLMPFVTVTARNNNHLFF